MLGLSDHVTDVSVVPVTVAFSCWNFAGATVAELGDKEMTIDGTIVTVVLADLPIDELLTVTVTVV